MVLLAQQIRFRTAQAGLTLALVVLCLSTPAQAESRRAQASAEASVTVVTQASLDAEQAMSVTGLSSGASDGEVTIGRGRPVTRGGAALARDGQVHPALVSVSDPSAAYDLDVPETLAVGPLRIATASLAADGSGAIPIGGVLKIPAGAPAGVYAAVLPVTAVFN